MSVRDNSPPPKPARKQADVVAAVRGRILGGTYPPGSRLPTHVDLLTELGVSSVTVQRALDRLAADGFIEPRGRQGTFVTDSPPHLRNYALIFPSHPGEPYLYPWSKFWTALSDAAGLLGQTTRRTITVYHDIDGHADRESYQLLVQQVRAHKLAGLIFATPPFYLQETPLLELPDLPRVAMMWDNAFFPSVKAVQMDALGETGRALDYLAERGRRRVGFLLHDDWTPGLAQMAADALAARGMISLPHWVQTLSPRNPISAQQCVNLLMRHRGSIQDDDDDRPNGLVVSDDHLVEFVERGLVEAGARVPQDVEVVAHANFPLAMRNVLPLRRLGPDVRLLLWQCVGLIDRQRRGEAVPEVTISPVFFENQVPHSLDFASADASHHFAREMSR